MKKRYIVILALLIVVGPVLARQLFPPEPRQYSGVTLDQVQYTEVTFRNDAAGLDLAGMLFVPDGEGPFPAAVIIHGSGTSNRQNRWYLTLTKHLQDNGIAVLLPDKRGSEQSSGDWRSADFEQLATDTLAAVDFMHSQEIVPLSAIGVIGMSQGGWIAPIVARETDDLAFVVSMVGSTVTPKEQLLFEEDHNIRQMGFLPGVSYGIALISTQHIRRVRMPEFYDAVGDYDPIPLWSKMDVPALAIFGRDDTNVPSERSAARLEALGRDSLQIIMFDGSGHAVQDPAGRGDSLIRKEALDAIARHVTESTAGTGAYN
ncbi:MAG: alpha/beta fold hydrolase [Woeseiaceae bacterium]|nr:alpha/beta fold hydrolase [Woeseiaceae bacterium]